MIVVGVEVIVVQFVEVIPRRTQRLIGRRRGRRDVIKRIEVEPSIGVIGVGIGHDGSWEERIVW